MYISFIKFLIYWGYKIYNLMNKSYRLYDFCLLLFCLIKIIFLVY